MIVAYDYKATKKIAGKGTSPNGFDPDGSAAFLLF